MANDGKTILQLPLQTSLYDANDTFVFVYGYDTANNSNNGVAQTALISAGNLFGSNAAANGHTFLPNGLLFQWLTANANSSATSISVPVPFPTQVLSVQCTGNTGGVITAAVAPANTTAVSITGPIAANVAYSLFIVGN